MENEKRTAPHWIYGVLLIVILAVGGYFRVVGLDWDENQHLHPDERFLTMVTSAISSVEDVGEYFDTANSSLNPHNRGYGFYVYGTLPIFLVRYVGEALEQTGYSQIYLVGRVLSALMDLLTVCLVYFIGARVYDRRVGLLGAAFSAFAVLQIQLSHYFAVDTFTTFFTVLAVYFAVEVGTFAPSPSGSRLPKSGADANTVKQRKIRLSSFVLFGLALGMAVSSKISAAPVALTLPLAAWIYWSKLPTEEQRQAGVRVFGYLVFAAFLSVLTFRVFQPYAFSGPGFFGLKPNELWVSNLQALRAQTSGDVDFPPALQWARRPSWFAFENLVLWGMGLPLGILSWAGFLWIAWRMFKEQFITKTSEVSGSWKKHFLLWSWTALYFSWQSSLWNSMMRYQLCIYPFLALFAAWTVFTLWDEAGREWQIGKVRFQIKKNAGRLMTFAIAAVVLLTTFGYAYAFTGVFTRPHTRVAATRWIFQNVPGAVTLTLETEDGSFNQLLPYPAETTISAENSWQTNIIARKSGELTTITLPHIFDESELGTPQTLRVELFAQSSGQTLAILETELTFDATFQTSHVFQLTEPVTLTEEQSYGLRFSLANAGVISLKGAAVANESSWDDGQPLRMDSYDPFGGIYDGGLNFEMYWDDNADKLERFITNLDQADYIFITSSRQWASTTRVPERYPLTSEYYRHLMGCPSGLEIEKCYNIAQKGMFQGDFGFELVEVFQSNPSLGNLEINDQPSEEAFTVYDHPKVFIFKKSDAYDSTYVREVLSAVDLSNVIHLTPKQSSTPVKDLMLTPARLEEQRNGGTWSQIFNPDAPHNRYQILGVFLWYFSVGLLGLAVYPLARYLLPGLADKGYPLARTIGLLLLSYLAWLAGSIRIPFTRGTIGVVLLLILAAGAFLAYRQRDALREEWRSNRRYFLMVEGLALVIFVIALLIRFGNPDLWHPWKGGEKPMDFSYFNAVLKSTSFPPYDPWFAGGYINYYYYGFVFVGVLVKFLGIVPAFAYNLILPTVLTLIALGAFSIVWNLSENLPHKKYRFLTSLTGTLGMAVLGNLGILRMVLRGFQRLAAGEANIIEAGLFNKIKWTFVGFYKAIGGTSLMLRPDEWYWNPSRVIGAEHGGPITEFPFFSFLYGDLHAHFIALPLALLALAWSISLVLKRWAEPKNHPSWPHAILSLMLGGLAVGALRPTNTWDFYPYLALGVLALGYSLWNWRNESKTKDNLKWLGFMTGGVILFVALAHLFYKPFTHWYGQGYTKIMFWEGSHTPLSDYFTHWGVFLFLVISWMFYETIHWMAHTPVSALRKLKPYRDLIIGIGFSVLVVMAVLGINLSSGNEEKEFFLLGLGVHIVWVVLPLMVWAGVLLLRRGLPIAKRAALFLVGTALALTLMVEIIVLQGDIGRMNTVFKFYLQAWTMLSISAAVGFGWLFSTLERWPRWMRGIWQIGLACLIGMAALYPLLGGMAKIEDRMTIDAPHTLDGMEYMRFAEYNDLGTSMALDQDYQAIRWLQENVKGSPVIVEANQVEYHWGTRYTIYTGLPNVVGWNWHQRQQRTSAPNSGVQERVDAVNDFYNTTDMGKASDFIKKYDVQYIILGQLEQAKYDAAGLEKFSAAEGVLWNSVYQDRDTVIYWVLGDW